mgnify:CR=1 FL=1
MNNDYKGGSWSERFSWIITIVAMVLVAILSIGLLCALFIQPKDDKQEDTKQTAVNEQATVMDGEGNAMVSGKTYAMPQRMVFAATAAETATANEGITLTATVSPETADNKAVDWSVAFVNPSSSWAKGKNVADYVTVTPTSDGALTANVNCLKAFGEQIKVTVTSRVNPEAKAECTLDYARRILDTALYHEEMDKNILEFGSDEILLDMEVPDFEGFKDGMSDGTIWAGGYYLNYLNPGVQISPEDEADPEAKWGDESASRTYRFSDYTIKDCLPFFSEGNEYGLVFEDQTDVNQDIIDLFCNFAREANADKGSPIFSFQEIARNGFRVGNNPVMMAIEMLTGYNGVGMSNFDAALYEKYMGLFVDWVQENPDTPIAEYTVTFTGKYSTFTRHYSFRFNPETVEMPVFSLGLDKTEVVI